MHQKVIGSHDRVIRIDLQKPYNPSQKTIFVVDDDYGARQSVVSLVSSKGFSVEDYSSAEEFLQNYDRSKSGCLILDVCMPGMSGLQLQEKLTAERIHLTIIMITGHGDIPMAVSAMRAGAFLFLEKPCEKEVLWENILLALQKDTLQCQQAQQRQEITSRLITLNNNELAVLEKMIDGKPNKLIAAELDIGLRTVELRRANVFKKMHADSLANLVRMASQIDLLPSKIDE